MKGILPMHIRQTKQHDGPVALITVSLSSPFKRHKRRLEISFRVKKRMKVCVGIGNQHNGHIKQ